MNIIVALFILGIIVLIHELGHFLLAKKNGITVTEFSIGMGPRIASFVRNGTRYSLKVLPIGGSCMMLGEDDTIEDEGAFNKKSVGARFSVIFAGAFFNFIFAFVLALVYLGFAGIDKPYIREVTQDGPAYGLLSEDDLIVGIDGSAMHFSRDVYYHFYFNPPTDKPIDFTVIRNGEKTVVTVMPYVKYYLGCDYSRDEGRAKLTYVTEGFPLYNAGIKEGDVIVNIDGTEIDSGLALQEYLAKNPFSGRDVTLTYVTEAKPDERITVVLTPVKSGQLGCSYSFAREKVSPLMVVKYSIFELKHNIVNTLKSVFYLITGKVSVREIAGPVGIVNVVGDIVSTTKEVGIGDTILSLLSFSILISANLGVMNLLPLPALDGGRLVFILIEAIRRKPVPKDKEALVHAVGMVLLMLLMVFVLYNDIRNIIS
jgi:regulator of sigma E protease